MITWMQRHKKWLVITIWISTIAFVGAGFVGWGSYNYGTKGGVVATVGNKEVTIEDYQQEYSSLYSQYAKMFGDSFNKEFAEKLRLKDTAFTRLLQKSLLIAYGESLGLIVTEEEIAKELLNYDEFKSNGVFDKDKYIKLLSLNKMTPREFEDSLKNSILFQKVQALFDLQATPKEIENISKLIFLEDDIEYKILQAKDMEVSLNEDDLKKFYEENKNNYLSEVSYDLEIKELALKSSNASQEDISNHFEKFKSDYKFEDGKLKTFDEAKDEVIQNLDENFTKKEALSLYLKLKKSEESFDTTSNFTASNLPFKEENIQKIKEIKQGDIVKPFFENGKFFIVKVAKVNAASILSFDEAKNRVTEDFTKKLQSDKLNETSQASLKDFKGTKALNINRSSTSKIEGLNEEEAIEFLNQLFFNDKKEDIIKVGLKSVLYRVLDSKLQDYDKEKDSFIQNEIAQIKSEDLLTNLLKKLENTFVIKSFMEKGE